MKRSDVEQKIEELFTRGVGDFYDSEEKLKEKILQKNEGKYDKDIVIKFGVDPTRPDIHLGHAVVLRKLRTLQDLGCKVIFLVGDFTAQIGDPTGKSKVRPELEQKEIEANMKTYLDQVGKILKTDKKSFSWMRNSEWYYNITDIVSPKEMTMNIEGAKGKTKVPIQPNSFIGKAMYYENTRMQKTVLKKSQVSGVSLRNFLSTLKHVSFARLVERDMFQERIKNGKELSMHEMMYPVLQGIDSVMIEKIYNSCDLEVGGSDQTFNMLLARDIMKMNKQSAQAVLSFEILTGTDGKEKMSKSLDNYISIIDSPSDMYGKVMSLPDTALISYFTLCTYSTKEAISDIEGGLKKGENPRDVKMRLAREIVSLYHGEEASKGAQDDFVKTFQKGGLPDDLLEVQVKKGTLLADLLLKEKFVDSKSEFHRLLKEGAISIYGAEKITDPTFPLEKEIVVKVGKKRFLKILLSESE